MKIKAISLWQPWATLIAVGAKKYETRSWKTNYRGALLICASRERNILMPALQEIRQKADELKIQNPITGAIFFPLGVAVAVVELTECIETELFKRGHPEFLRESLLGDFSSGRYAWKLENVRSLDLFPVKGKQGLFDVEVPDSLFK